MSQNKPYPPITLSLLKQKRCDKLTLANFPRYFGGIFGIGLAPMRMDHRAAKVVCEEFDFEDMARNLLNLDDLNDFWKNTEKGLETFKIEKEKLEKKMYKGKGWSMADTNDHEKWLRFTSAQAALFRKYHWEVKALSFCRLYRKGMSK